MTQGIFGRRTQLIHGVQKLDRSEKTFLYAHSKPIAQTSTFRFDSVQQAQEVFSGRDLKHEAYSRISNPNHRDLEEKLANLEYGEAAQVFDSGMSAIKTLIETLTRSGQYIIAHRSLYGGTYNLLKKWQKFGVNTHFVDARNVANVFDALGAAEPSETPMIFIESPSNPTLDVIDFDRIKTGLLKRGWKNIYVVVDNTFATPYNQNPLLFGADIVIHSLTKYLNGYGNNVGGVVISSKSMMKIIWDNYGASGGTMSPEVAANISMNLLSFPDRMKKHNENGLEIAHYLAKNMFVEKVYYPCLSGHINKDVALKFMRGWGGMVSFELRSDDQAKTEKFLNQLAKDSETGKGVITLAVSLGTVDSLIISPALTTHFGVPMDQRMAQGISDKLIRMSVGTENIEDIIYSLERGFKAI